AEVARRSPPRPRSPTPDAAITSNEDLFNGIGEYAFGHLRPDISRAPRAVVLMGYARHQQHQECCGNAHGKANLSTKLLINEAPRPEHQPIVRMNRSGAVCGYPLRSVQAVSVAAYSAS